MLLANPPAVIGSLTDAIPTPACLDHPPADAVPLPPAAGGGRGPGRGAPGGAGGGVPLLPGHLLGSAGGPGQGVLRRHAAGGGDPGALGAAVRPRHLGPGPGAGPARGAGPADLGGLLAGAGTLPGLRRGTLLHGLEPALRPPRGTHPEPPGPGRAPGRGDARGHERHELPETLRGLPDRLRLRGTGFLRGRARGGGLRRGGRRGDQLHLRLCQGARVPGDPELGGRRPLRHLLRGSRGAEPGSAGRAGRLPAGGPGRPGLRLPAGPRPLAASPAGGPAGAGLDLEGRPGRRLRPAGVLGRPAGLPPPPAAGPGADPRPERGAGTGTGGAPAARGGPPGGAAVQRTDHPECPGGDRRVRPGPALPGLEPVHGTAQRNSGGRPPGPARAGGHALPARYPGPGQLRAGAGRRGGARGGFPLRAAGNRPRRLDLGHHRPLPQRQGRDRRDHHHGQRHHRPQALRGPAAGHPQQPGGAGLRGGHGHPRNPVRQPVRPGGLGRLHRRLLLAQPPGRPGRALRVLHQRPARGRRRRPLRGPGLGGPEHRHRPLVRVPGIRPSPGRTAAWSGWKWPSTSPSAAGWSSRNACSRPSFSRPRKWRAWESWPAASPTT